MIKAVVTKHRLRFEKGIFENGAVLELTEEEAERLSDGIQVVTEEQAEAIIEAQQEPAPELSDEAKEKMSRAPKNLPRRKSKKKVEAKPDISSEDANASA